MNIKSLLIDRFSSFVLGGEAWGQIQAAVNIVEDPNRTGSEKREQALDLLKRLGIALAGYLINLGLELAVAKLREKSQ